MVNWDRISELREEVGEDDLSEVLALFCEEVEDVLEQLPVAEQSSLKGHLHFLKGSALNIGLDDLSGLCQEEEKNLASDPTGSIRTDAIQLAYKAARAELSDLITD